MSTKELAIQIRMPYASKFKVICKMAWGDDDGGDKKKGCFKCGEKIREIYVPKEEIDDSKLCKSLAVSV